VDPEARRHIQAGLEAKKAGRLDEAAKELRRVVEIEPNLWAAQSSLGEVYYLQHDYAKAVPVFKRSLELNPEQTGVRGMLGVTLLALGYAAEAIPHLEKAQVSDALGVAYMATGRFRDAVAQLDKQKNDPEVLFQLGQALEQWSKETLNRVLIEYPDSVRARQLRAELLAAVGRSDAAEREYRELIRTNPPVSGIHFALGELMSAAGDIERAVEEYGLELTSSPGNAPALAKRGAAMLKLGRIAEARQDLDQANKLRPNTPDILYELARACDLSGDARQAEVLWLQVIEQGSRSPAAVQSHHQLSLLYRRLGNAPAAEKHKRLFESLQR
jgi:tetratricopeptide (TPR) repeat protein